MQGAGQDMPPPGGFNPVTYQRVPLKRYMPAPLKWLALAGTTALGAYLYSLDKKRIMYNDVEKRSASLSIQPLLMAENDRMRLRQCRQMRDFEAELMKDVEGWEVGKCNGEPIYKSLGPDDWYEPSTAELWLFAKEKDKRFASSLLRYL